MSDFRVEKPGYYRRRDGTPAYVGAIAPADLNIGASYQVVGWFRNNDGDWLETSWGINGKFFDPPLPDSHQDLVAYIGETLRRLPDSPGWWHWQDNNNWRPVRVSQSNNGQLVVHGVGYSPYLIKDCPGRWGDKIEPSGFEEFTR